MSERGNYLMDEVERLLMAWKRTGKVQHFSVVLMEQDGEVTYQSCCERAEHTFLSAALRAHGHHSRATDLGNGLASPRPGEASSYD